jgi:hypothetical protein
MKVTIEKNELVIRIGLNEAAPLSSTGKTRVIASTGGFTTTDVAFKGQPVKVNLTATIPPQ